MNMIFCLMMSLIDMKRKKKEIESSDRIKIIPDNYTTDPLEKLFRI